MDGQIAANGRRWGSRGPNGRSPIRVALVNEYEVVALGVEQMLAPYADRVALVRLNHERELRERVDIALYDNCAQAQAVPHALSGLLSSPLVQRTVIYTWTFRSDLIDEPNLRGFSGYLSKTLPAHALVDALEQIHAGKMVVSPAPKAARLSLDKSLGRQQVLSHREAQVLALITQGLSNAEIAATMFLSLNSVKSYIRSAYRKVGVTRRSQAVAWGIRNGLEVAYPGLGLDAKSA